MKKLTEEELKALAEQLEKSEEPKKEDEQPVAEAEAPKEEAEAPVEEPVAKTEDAEPAPAEEPVADPEPVKEEAEPEAVPEEKPAEEPVAKSEDSLPVEDITKTAEKVEEPVEPVEDVAKSEEPVEDHSLDLLKSELAKYKEENEALHRSLDDLTERVSILEKSSEESMEKSLEDNTDDKFNSVLAMVEEIKKSNDSILDQLNKPEIRTSLASDNDVELINVPLEKSAEDDHIEEDYINGKVSNERYYQYWMSKN